MDKTKIVSVGTVDETLERMGRDFVEAWSKADRGERVAERELTYLPLETLAALSTEKRVAVLRHLRVHPERSISDLAKHLKRDYRRVHDDVTVLLGTGLVTKENGMLKAPFSKFEVCID